MYRVFKKSTPKTFSSMFTLVKSFAQFVVVRQFSHW